MNKNYYITTAIAYTSGKPHIGNVYEIVLADAIARYKRLKGYNVLFQTGTDEHGEKIEKRALENNMSPKEFCDHNAKMVKEAWDLMNTSYDKFVRTTDEDHKKTVQEIFQKLYDQGDIYLGTYEGKYCIYCESFFTGKDTKDNELCPDCNRKLEDKKEEAYFFKLSKYQDKLLKHIKENPDFIYPISRKNEMLNNFLKEELPDLCVSRSSFDWGIKVPFDEKHVIYVWIDALSNYISSLSYSPFSDNKDYLKYWPADLQVIGKDILRFHSIYWTIMLIALGLPLPKQIFAHPWLLMDEDKMSKSKGNIMYADFLVEKFGLDRIRYYLLHEIPFSSDGNITYDLLIDTSNSDLSNTLGNLVNRTHKMSEMYFDRNIINNNVQTEYDEDLINSINSLEENIEDKMNKLEIGNALEEIMILLRKANKYIDETMPWTLKKENKEEELMRVLYNLLETIRVSAVFLEAFLPDTALKIFNILNTSDKSFKYNENNKYSLNDSVILFDRIKKDEKLKEIKDELN